MASSLWICRRRLVGSLQPACAFPSAPAITGAESQQVGKSSQLNSAIFSSSLSAVKAARTSARGGTAGLLVVATRGAGAPTGSTTGGVATDAAALVGAGRSDGAMLFAGSGTGRKGTGRCSGAGLGRGNDT